MSRVVNPRLALLRQSPVTVAPSRGAIVSSQPVEEVRTLPASVGPGDRLYAVLGSTSYDLTAVVEGDRVRVPYGARLTCVSSSGETRWTEENRGVRPSGDLGGRGWSTVPRIKLRLANFCEGYTLSAVGWPSLNEVPYPENSPTDEAAPRFTSSDSGSIGSAGMRCGTYNVGFPEEITPRVLLVRYGPHTVGSFAVRPDPTTGIASIDLNAIPTAALRLVGLPPGSRVLDANNVDITTNRPSGGDGGWERVGGNAQGAWVIGVPSSTRSVKIRYPNGRDLTVAVPPTLLRGALSVNVPPQPAIPRARVRLVFPQVTPARVFAVNSSGARGEDVTLFAQPDGTNATWDGTTWVFGIPLDTTELDVRDERSGQTVRLALPAGARTAGETVSVNFPQPNAGMGGGGGLGPVRTNPAQRFEARIRFPSPQAARIYLASGDTLGEEVTTSAPPSGSAPQWVGSAWVIGLPVGTRRIAVVFADGVRQFVDLPAVTQGQSVTIDLPPRPGATAENMVNLRIENAAQGDQVFVGEADATTWSLANGGASTYDAATRVRTIGIPNTTTSVRVRTTDGVVRSFTVPPPVSGVSTLRIPAPDVAPTRKDVRAMGFVQGAKLFVDGVEVTNAPLTNGQPAGWADEGRTQWNFSVPSAARSVTIEYPSRASRTLPISTAPAPGLSGGYYEVVVPADTGALGGGSGNGSLLSVARRIKVVLRGIPGAFSTPTAWPGQAATMPQVMYGGQNIASTPLPNGSPARADSGQDIGSRSNPNYDAPFFTSMEFGFDFNPAITQEFTVIAGNDRRQFDVRAADIVPDPTDRLHFVLPLSWSGGADMSYPGIEPPPRLFDSSGNVRIWMIDPPAGTYAVARSNEGEERQLDGTTTQLSTSVALNPNDMPNGVGPLAGGANDAVWVTEASLPDGVYWVTTSAFAVLPNGTRIPVNISHVPQDGILRVQLSAYPGNRPTRPSVSGGTRGEGGGIGFGTVAVVGGAAAALWYYRKSLGRFFGNG